jgi:hypothetical protein
VARSDLLLTDDDDEVAARDGRLVARVASVLASAQGDVVASPGEGAHESQRRTSKPRNDVDGLSQAQATVLTSRHLFPLSLLHVLLFESR